MSVRNHIQNTGSWSMMQEVCWLQVVGNFTQCEGNRNMFAKQNPIMRRGDVDGLAVQMR
jgi:hypothetical protein